MSFFKQLFGLDSGSGATLDGETRSVRLIANELAELDPDRARYLAAFAYILARVAHADLRVEEEEVGAMQQVLVDVGGRSAEEARLVVTLAQEQAEDLGGSENYLVTREFRRISSRAERTSLLECLYAVAASDDTISVSESSEIYSIAEELGFARSEATALRSRWRDHLAELKPSGSNSN